MRANLKQKTRDYLKKEYGAVVGNVEFFNPHSRQTVDLFGLFDILAIFNHTLYGIQVTSSSNFSLHHTKLINNKNLFFWLDAENKAWLVKWEKKKVKRGGKAYKWQLKIREYWLVDYREIENENHSKLKVDDQVVVWEDNKGGDKNEDF